jgi:ATP-binding cassette subfamily B protein/subfamily B ATP-binding cassette protein MsbA
MKYSLKGLSSSVNYYNAQSIYAAIINIIVGIWVAILIAVGASQVISGRITIGILVVFVSYLAVMLISVSQASEYIANMRAAVAGTDRIFHVLKEPPVKDSGNIIANSLLFHQPIKYIDVSFSYDSQTPVIDRINLTIPPGSKVAIVGPTGAGKSTLVSLLPRFYELSAGEIVIGDTDINDFRLSSLRENISLVLQPPFLFPGTIYGNIIYGNASASFADVVAACKAARIHSYIANLPQGYHTYIGERAQQLSQGQKQRITIARALIKNAPLLILDEPTSAMDAETEYEVMMSLDSLTRNKTSIIIAHRLSTVKAADIILVMNKGRIVETGTYAELVSKNGLFAKLHRHSLGLEA